MLVTLHIPMMVLNAPKANIVVLIKCVLHNALQTTIAPKKALFAKSPQENT